jgi:hypothetical protein
LNIKTEQRKLKKDFHYLAMIQQPTLPQNLIKLKLVKRISQEVGKLRKLAHVPKHQLINQNHTQRQSLKTQSTS